jgi:predicted helicase
LKWINLTPDKRNNWLTKGLEAEFSGFPTIGEKHAGSEPISIFDLFCRGTCTNNDQYVYDFSRKNLEARVRKMVDSYAVELTRWQKNGRGKKVEEVIHIDASVLKWIRRTKRELERGIEAKFDLQHIRLAQYRPFCVQALYFERLFNEDLYRLPSFFPTSDSEKENKTIVLTDSGSEKPFMVLMCNRIPDMHIVGGGASSQVFPLYCYSIDGKDRRDNITTKARTLFQIFYDDDSIARKDIFHYTYALLHNPTYRTRYAENLKRELPRIPFVGVRTYEKTSAPARFFPLAAVEKMQGDAKPDHNPKTSAKLFHALADIGQKLAELHVKYESAKEFPLARQENKEVKLDWRVEAMKLTKDKASIIYNDFLTLNGIPGEVFEYRLGNRSALEWVIDQYRVTRDDKGNIVNDPNRMDDEQYIVRLIGQVITVSLETVRLVKALPLLQPTPEESKRPGKGRK